MILYRIPSAALNSIGTFLIRSALIVYSICSSGHSLCVLLYPTTTSSDIVRTVNSQNITSSGQHPAHPNDKIERLKNRLFHFILLLLLHVNNSWMIKLQHQLIQFFLIFCSLPSIWQKKRKT